MAVSNSNLRVCGSPGLPAQCFDLSQDLAGVKVYVQNQPVPVLYVNPGQVNFIMPSTALTGPVVVRVVNNANSGPEVTVTLVGEAPAMFANPSAAGYVIATDASGKTVLTGDTPAHPGDVVVLYLTGLGMTTPNPAVGEIPSYAASICQMDQTAKPPVCSATLGMQGLQVTLNGTAVDSKLILYAGVTPGSAGLYQINFYVPAGTGDDPVIGVTAGGQPAQTGLKLAVR